MKQQIKDLALELNLSFDDILCNGYVIEDKCKTPCSCEPDPCSDCCCGSVHCLPSSCGTPIKVPEVPCECEPPPSKKDDKEEKEQKPTNKQTNDRRHKSKTRKHRSRTPISSNNKQEHETTKKKSGHTKKEHVSPSRKQPTRHRGRSRKKHSKQESQKDDKKSEKPSDSVEADSPKSDQTNRDSIKINEDGDSKLQQCVLTCNIDCQKSFQRKFDEPTDRRGSVSKSENSKERISESDKKDQPEDVVDGDAKSGENAKVDVDKKHRRRRKHSQDSTESADSPRTKKKHHKRKTKKAAAGEDRHKRKKSPLQSDTEDEATRHPKVNVSTDDTQQEKKTEWKCPFRKDEIIHNELSEKLDNGVQCPSRKFPYHLLCTPPCAKADTVVQTEPRRKCSSLKRTSICSKNVTDATQTCATSCRQKRELPIQTDGNFVMLPGPIYIAKQAIKCSPPICPYEPPGLRTIQVAPVVADINGRGVTDINGRDVTDINGRGVTVINGRGAVAKDPTNTSASHKKPKDRDSYTQTRANQFSCNRPKCGFKSCVAFSDGRAREDLLLSDDYDAGMPESVSQFFPTIATQTTSSDFLMIERIMMMAAQEAKRQPKPPSLARITPSQLSYYRRSKAVERKPLVRESIVIETTNDDIKPVKSSSPPVIVASGSHDESITVEEVETIPSPSNVVVKKKVSTNIIPQEVTLVKEDVVLIEEKPEKVQVKPRIRDVMSEMGTKLKTAMLMPENEMIGPEDVDDEELLDSEMAHSMVVETETGQEYYDAREVGLEDESSAKEAEEESSAKEAAATEEEEHYVSELEDLTEALNPNQDDSASILRHLSKSDNAQNRNRELRGSDPVMVGHDDEDDDDFMKKLDHKPRMSMTTSMEHRIKKVVHETELFRHPEEKGICWTGDEAGIDLTTNLNSRLSINDDSSIMGTVSGLIGNKSLTRDASKSTKVEELSTIGEEEVDED